MSLTKTVAEAPRDWLIRKNGYYYRPDRRGYTGNVHEAGQYTEVEAKAEASIQPECMEAVPLFSVLNGYTDSDLMQRWMRQEVRNPAKRGGIQLWAKVSERFCIGSTSAREVCRRHGVTPDTMVRKS